MRPRSAERKRASGFPDAFFRVRGEQLSAALPCCSVGKRCTEKPCRSRLFHSRDTHFVVERQFGSGSRLGPTAVRCRSPPGRCRGTSRMRFSPRDPETADARFVRICFGGDGKETERDGVWKGREQWAGWHFSVGCVSCLSVDWPVGCQCVFLLGMGASSLFGELRPQTIGVRIGDGGFSTFAHGAILLFDSSWRGRMSRFPGWDSPGRGMGKSGRLRNRKRFLRCTVPVSGFATECVRVG